MLSLESPLAVKGWNYLFSGAFRMCKAKALVIPRPNFWIVKIVGVGEV